MATYRGSPFEAGVGPAEGDIVLFAACPPPEDLGFEPATGHWRKQVRLHDVEAVWESRPVGTFRGERCMVLDDLGDRLHIGYLGHDEYHAEQLGYWQVDRGVFELVAPRTQVTQVIEERVSYPPQPVSPGPAAPAGGREPGGPPERRNDEVPRYDTGQYSFVPPFDQAGEVALAQSLAPQAYLPVPDEVSGVALAEPTRSPLPLEAEAMRAASASRLAWPEQAVQPPAVQPPAVQPPADQPAVQPLAARPPAVQPPAVQPPAHQPPAHQPPADQPPVDSPARAPDPVVTLPKSSSKPRQRRKARQQLASEELFSQLTSMAGIAAGSYAVGEEVDGALCLLHTQDGFEVFHASGGSRHEVQLFSTEEAACFYLFGLLVADAVRNGSLLPAAAHPV